MLAVLHLGQTLVYFLAIDAAEVCFELFNSNKMGMRLLGFIHNHCHA